MTAITVADKIVISGSDDGTVRRWHLQTGEPIGEPLRGHEHWVTAVAVANGIVISGSKDNTLRRWDLQTGQSIGKPLRAQESGITAVAVANGIVAAGSPDGTVRRWDLRTGVLLNIIPFGSSVYALTLAENAIIAACYSGLVRIDILR